MKDIQESELTPKLKIANVSFNKEYTYVEIRFVEKETAIRFYVRFSELLKANYSNQFFFSKQDEINPYITHHTIYFQISRNKIKKLTFDTEFSKFFDEIIQRSNDIEMAIQE